MSRSPATGVAEGVAAFGPALLLRALCVASLLLACAALSAQELPSEESEGLSYVPSRAQLLSPSALRGRIPENPDYARYDDFPRVDTALSERGITPTPAGEVDSALDDSRWNEVLVLWPEHGPRSEADNERDVIAAAVPRSEELPFALIDEGSASRYDARVWSAAVSYHNLYAGTAERGYLVDLGSLYEAVLSDSEDDWKETPSLPASPVDATYRYVEEIGETLLFVSVDHLISMDNPRMPAARSKLMLRLGEHTLEMVGMFMERLLYPDGHEYEAAYEFLSGSPPGLKEESLRRSPLGGGTQRYRITVGEYRMHEGRFVRSTAAATVWEERFPHTLETAEEGVHLRTAPHGEAETVGAALPAGQRVRAIEPSPRLDHRDGVEGVWYRVRSGAQEGWIWAPDFRRPE